MKWWKWANVFNTHATTSIHKTGIHYTLKQSDMKPWRTHYGWLAGWLTDRTACHTVWHALNKSYSRLGWLKVSYLHNMLARSVPEFQLRACQQTVGLSVQLNPQQPYTMWTQFRFHFFLLSQAYNWSHTIQPDEKEVIYSFNSNSVSKSRFPSLPWSDRMQIILFSCQFFFSLSLGLTLITWKIQCHICASFYKRNAHVMISFFFLFPSNTFMYVICCMSLFSSEIYIWNCFRLSNNKSRLRISTTESE